MALPCSSFVISVFWDMLQKKCPLYILLSSIFFEIVFQCKILLMLILVGLLLYVMSVVNELPCLQSKILISGRALQHYATKRHFSRCFKCESIFWVVIYTSIQHAIAWWLCYSCMIQSFLFKHWWIVIIHYVCCNSVREIIWINSPQLHMLSNSVLLKANNFIN